MSFVKGTIYYVSVSLKIMFGASKLNPFDSNFTPMYTIFKSIRVELKLMCYKINHPTYINKLNFLLIIATILTGEGTLR
jgi:hypothetical protein